MKKLLLTLALTLCLAGTAMAQIDWNSNEIGFFFDQAGLQVCGQLGSGMTQAYLMLKGPVTSVAGWEVYTPVTVPEGSMVLSWDLMGLGPINIYTPPYFMVVMGVPFPQAGRVHVATANLFVGGPGAWLFYVKPLPYAYRPSIAGVPCYADGENVDNLIPLAATSGNYLAPVAELNGTCGVVSAKDDTWGGVKSMYR